MSSKPSSWCVYVLLLADRSCYVGMTQRLAERVEEHQSGRGAAYVSNRLPAALLWYKEVEDSKTARQLEKWLKRRSAPERRSYLFANGHLCLDYQAADGRDQS